jgi:hypothetical protein
MVPATANTPAEATASLAILDGTLVGTAFLLGAGQVVGGPSLKSDAVTVATSSGVPHLLRLPRCSVFTPFTSYYATVRP